MIGFDFASIDFQSGEYRTTDTDAWSAPKKEAKMIELARTHGSVQVFERLQGKTINAGGYIKAADGAALRDAIERFNSLLLIGNQPLRITEEGTYREWMARLQNVNISRDETQVTYAVWSAQFMSEKPYSVDGNVDTIVDVQGITDGSYNAFFTSQGSFPGYPVILITLNGIEPDDAEATITIGNPATSQSLDFTDIFTDGDVISIDTLTRRCFKNTQPISPEGDFPAWIPGPGTLSYSDNGTTRDVDILATQDRRFM